MTQSVKKSRVHATTRTHSKPPAGSSKLDSTRPASVSSKSGDGNSPESGRESSQRDTFKASVELKEEAKTRGAERTTGEGDHDRSLEEVKNALAELLRELDKEKKPKEDPGGCCGRPKSPNDSPGEKDWNSVLLADVAAVKANRLGGDAPGIRRGPKNSVFGTKAVPGGSKRGLRVPGRVAQLPGQPHPLGKLQSDYTRAKSSGQAIRPEVEMAVEECLNGATAAQPDHLGVRKT